jgi:hypothetical protein
LIDELVQISGKICELKPVKEIDDQQELDRLKKKVSVLTRMRPDMLRIKIPVWYQEALA